MPIAIPSAYAIRTAFGAKGCRGV